MNKYTIIGIIVGAAALFALGRYTCPEKIRIETKIVTVEKEVEKKDTEANKHKVTVIIKKADGSSETTITDDVSKNTQESSETDVTQTKDKISETTRSSGRTTFSILAGAQPHLFQGISLGPIVYGASVNKDILGPINVGAWGLSDYTFGVSLGLSF